MLTKLQNIDIKAINSFIAIVECKGLSAAQSRLNVSASVVSGHLKHLEDSLGMTLCQRGRSGFELTVDGEAVYQSCLELSDAMHQFQYQMHYIRQLDKTRGGHIQLALADQLPSQFYHALHRAIAKVYDEYSQIHCSIRIQSPEVMVEGLITNESDIGIGYFENFLSLLNYEVAFSEKQVLCCAATHPLFSQPDPSLKVLESRYMWVNRGYEIARPMQKINPSRRTATAYHMDATAQIILAGSHVGYLPENLALSYVEKGQMRILLEDKTSYVVQHHFAYKPELQPVASLFFATLRRFIEDTPDLY